MLTGKKGRGNGGIRKIFAGNFISFGNPTFRIFEHNALKRGTAIESKSINHCHAIGNDNALKPGAPRKHIAANLCHTIGNDDFRKPGTG